MVELQKTLLTEQNKFIKKYNETFSDVMYKGYADLFKMEMDVEWFTKKLKIIKNISDRIDECSTDEIDYFIINRKKGNIDMYMINVFIRGLYSNILNVIKTLKETPF